MNMIMAMVSTLLNIQLSKVNILLTKQSIARSFFNFQDGNKNFVLSITRKGISFIQSPASRGKRELFHSFLDFSLLVTQILLNNAFFSLLRNLNENLIF